MKNLLACLAILAAFNVSAQVDGFQLPYNPDVEPDGYIGVGDVLELLAMFGQQWNASDIYLSNDSSSMTMLVGQLIHPLCLAACADLPGSWQMSSLTDLGRIWDELPAGEVVWVKPVDENFSTLCPAVNLYSGMSYTTLQPSNNGYCYCSTHERPKVEYSICTGTNPDIFGECTTAKVAEGWYPLPNRVWDIGGTTVLYSFSQAFWRWAE